MNFVIAILIIFSLISFIGCQILSWSNFRPQDTCGLKCSNGGIFKLKPHINHYKFNQIIL